MTDGRHHVIVRRSGRRVPVIVEGPIFWILHPTSGPYPSVSGPYPHDDPRFEAILDD